MNAHPGSPPPRPSDDESIAATAAAWLAQRDDTFSAADAAAFERWCAADPRHADAVCRLERAWATLQPLRNFRPTAQRHPDRDLLSGPARPSRGVIFPLRAFAFAAALMLTLGFWAVRTTSTSTLRYTTTAGGYERVILADHSVLELNGDTAAEVTYTAVERRVRLMHGEAHFTVAKNPARPFQVEAQGIAVRAVGTAFNVRLGAGEVEVLVTEGKVAVSEVEHVDPNALSVKDEPKPTRWGQPVPPTKTLVAANERVVVGPARESAVERVSPAAMRDALAWQSPRLVFVDTPLAEVVAQFNRRNAVQLELADADSVLAALPVGGSFRPENVEAFVRLLESGGDVTVDRADAARLVLRRTK